MPKFLFILIGLFSLSYSTLLIADNDLRKIFISAEKQVWQADSARYKLLYKKLENYSLQPYLDQKRLIHTMHLKNAQQIGDFLIKYESTPLDWPLRKKWLQYLAKRKRKWMFLNFYRPNSNSDLNCYFYRFQLDTGKAKKIVLPQVTKLWVVGKSQPKVCDPLFEQWQQSGYRTTSVVWQRVKLAANGGKHTLIPYLTKLLPEDLQYYAKLWHKVRRDPAYVRHLNKFPKNSTKSAEILTYGLKRLIWRNPSLALSVYEKAVNQWSFAAIQQQIITQKFAQALTSKKHKQARFWLNKISPLDLNENLIQWRLVEVLQQQNWSLINKELKTLPIQYHHKLQWKYWYARSLMATNEIELGTKLLNNIAKKRHYYGFLAAGLLQKDINIQDKPLFYNPEEKQAVLKYPAAKRAFELFNLQRYNLARREWNYWLTKLSNSEKLIAAKIAHEKGWFDRSIFTLAKQGYLDDVKLRFPLAYSEDITDYAKKNNILPAWVFAIARRESSFMSDAHSGAGAYGLMQILPSTAKHILRRKRISQHYLFSAKNNIKLGTKYLRKLLSQQNNNIVLATASYNAGPYRVRSWLKKQKKIPADIWIESIPYKETRDYVKSVLAYQQIYQYRENQSVALFKQLVTMEIGD